MRGVLPPQVDHESTDKTDNRFKNLRVCTTQQNCAGRGRRRDNASGFKGVNKRGAGWRARIRVFYGAIDLGQHATAVEAALAYDRAALKHFGEFARTNAMLGLL